MNDNVTCTRLEGKLIILRMKFLSLDPEDLVGFYNQDINRTAHGIIVSIDKNNAHIFKEMLSLLSQNILLSAPLGGKAIILQDFTVGQPGYPQGLLDGLVSLYATYDNIVVYD